MGERGMNLRMWLAGRWVQLIAVNALDEEEIRQGRFFNILMIISIVLVIFLALLFLLMSLLGIAETAIGLTAAASRRTMKTKQLPKRSLRWVRL